MQVFLGFSTSYQSGWSRGIARPDSLLGGGATLDDDSADKDKLAVADDKAQDDEEETEREDELVSGRSTRTTAGLRTGEGFVRLEQLATGELPATWMATSA